MTTFIATLAEKDVLGEGFSPARLIEEPDIDRPAVPTPDGEVLAFSSYANLTGQNPAERYAEVYRYSAVEESLVCVSCTTPGVEPTGNANFGETAGGTYDPPSLSSPMSADGSEVFFDTPDSLVPEDENAGAPPSSLTGEPSSTDVYEWEGGRVHLISCGCSSSPALLQGTTPSGDDVFFSTTASLVPQDTDGGFASLYDARVGGGFPVPPTTGHASCQSGCPEPIPAPPIFPTPVSEAEQGSGNLPSATAEPKPKSLTCRRGYVKKRVKKKTVCVKKATKAARASRGASPYATRRRVRADARPHPITHPCPARVRFSRRHRRTSTKCMPGVSGGWVPRPARDPDEACVPPLTCSRRLQHGVHLRAAGRGWWVGRGGLGYPALRPSRPIGLLVPGHYAHSLCPVVRPAAPRAE